MTKTLKWLGGGIAAAMLLGLAGLFSGEVAEAQPSGPPHRFAGSVSLDGEPAAAGTSVTAFVNGAECGSATVITSAAGSTYVLDVPDSCADAGDTVSFQVGGYDAAETGTWSGGGRTDLNLSATAMMPEDPEDIMEECPEEGMDSDMNGDMNGDAPAEPSEPSEPEAPAEPSEPSEDASEGDMPEGDMPEGDMPEGDMGEGDMDEDCPEGEMPPEEPEVEMPPEEPEVDTPEVDTPEDGGKDDPPGVSEAGTGLATSTSSSLAALLGVTALAIVLGGYTVARRRR